MPVAFRSRNQTLLRRLPGQLTFAVLSLISPIGRSTGEPKPPSVVIIVNPAVRAEEISAEDLRSVFLGVKASLSDGSHLKPVLEKAGPAHAAFLKDYLGKSDLALQTYYRSLVFSGKWSMPTMLRSDADVVSYVGKNRDAIGYAQASAASDVVKVLRIK